MKIALKYLAMFVLVINCFYCSNESDKLYNLLKDEQKKYPEMRAQDVYKLLYQSIFGVKHLLKDTAGSHAYLIQEYNSIEPKNDPLIENISLDSDVIRINLRVFKYKNLSLEKLFDVMKLSAENINGDPANFRKYWANFEKLVTDGNFIYDPGEIKLYKEKITDNPPEAHHSEIYIKTYSPSYRVVKKEIFLRFFPEVK